VLSQVRQEPMMVIGAALNVVVVLAAAFIPVAFGTRLTQDEMAALSTISTALTSAGAALMTTPVRLGVINSAVSTSLVAGAAFGLNLSPSNIAVITGSLATLLSYLMREKVQAVQHNDRR
jgi:hypothetical protein